MTYSAVWKWVRQYPLPTVFMLLPAFGLFIASLWVAFTGGAY
jgi:hypothetical protein